MSFEFDMSDVLEKLRLIGEIEKHLEVGAKKGMQRSVNIWRKRVFRDAPYDTGNLVDGIGDVEVNGNTIETLVGEFGVEAWSKWKGQPFNYAYYIHEKGNNGIPDPFITDGYEKVEARMRDVLEKAIADELKKAGW